MTNETRAPLAESERGAAALLVVGVLVRILGIRRQSPSLDEISELGLARLPSVPELVLAGDGFPPLFQLLLRTGLGVWNNDLVARLLALTFGCLLLPVIWKLARDTAGRRAAMFTLALAATSPWLVQASQDGRSYSLFYLASAVALLGFFRLLRQPAIDQSSRWATACLSLGLLVAAWTHYYTAILVLAMVAAVLFSREARTEWRSWLTRFAAIALTFLPLLFILHSDLSHQQAYADFFIVNFDFLALGYSFWSFLHGQTIGLSTAELHAVSKSSALTAYLPYILWSLAALLPLSIALVKTYRGAGREKRATVLQLLTLALLPVLIAGLLSTALGLTFKPSYAGWCALPLLLLAGIGLAASKRQTASLVLSALLALSFLGLYNRLALERFANDDLRSLAGWLTENAGPGDTVMVSAPYMAAPLRHHLPGWDLPAIPYADCTEETLAAANQRVLEELSKADTEQSWLVFSRRFHGDPCGHLADSLERGWDLEARAHFAGIDVYSIGHR